MKRQTLDFAVIGAQKCATSWLYYCLQEHPEICLPRSKREVAYIGGPQFVEKGEDWFFERFTCESGTLMGDVSVDYLFDTTSAPKLRHYMPHPKLIVSLRDPVARCISSYYWLCRSSVLPNVSIDRWVQSLPTSTDDWSAAIGKEASKVLLRGFYADQISEYVKTYGADSFHIVLYESIKSNPIKVLEGIFRFLDVNPEFVPKSLSAKPKKNSYNGFLMYLERRFKSRYMSYLVNLAHQGIAIVRHSDPPLSEGSHMKLRAIFKPQSEKLLEVLNCFPEGQRPDVEELRKAWQLG